MDQQESPAVARRRLRHALRKLREAAELTQGEVADRLDWSLSKVNRIELGDVAVSNTDLQALLRLFKMADEAYAEELRQHCGNARRRGWWNDPEYRIHVTSGTIKLLQFEGDARVIYVFQPTLIPGLLQLPGYAKEILGQWRDLSERERDARLRFRARMREHVFDRPSPPRCVFIMDESVLAREIGGREQMIDQLRELLSVATDDRVELRILPLKPATVLSAESPFVLMDMGDNDSVLYREFTAGDELVDNNQKEVATYESIVQQMLERSLSVEASLRLIEAKVAVLRSEVDRGLT